MIIIWVALISSNRFISLLELNFQISINSFFNFILIFIIIIILLNIDFLLSQFSKYCFNSNVVLDFRFILLIFVFVQSLSSFSIMKSKASFRRCWVFLNKWCLLVWRKVNSIHWIVLRYFYSFLQFFFKSLDLVLKLRKLTLHLVVWFFSSSFHWTFYLHPHRAIIFVPRSIGRCQFILWFASNLDLIENSSQLDFLSGWSRVVSPHRRGQGSIRIGICWFLNHIDALIEDRMHVCL